MPEQVDAKKSCNPIETLTERERALVSIDNKKRGLASKLEQRILKGLHLMN